MQPSPYTPGAVAREVIGRDKHLTAIQRHLSMLVNFPRLEGRIQVFVGPRGVGKTSLLRTAQHEAERLGLHTVWVTAGDGSFLEELLLQFSQYARRWQDTAAQALGSLVSGTRPASPSRHNLGRQIQAVLEKAGETARKHSHKGLVIFIDEIQATDHEGLRALAYAWQHMQSEAPKLPLIALTAGLSHTQDVITDAVSFAERFHYAHLGNLDAQASRTALTRPAKSVGVEWSQEALAQALEHASGYPYFLQLIGDLSWQAACDPDPGGLIKAHHVRTAHEDFSIERETLFRSRWMKATNRETDIMVAMAKQGDGPVRRGHIAQELGIRTTDLSMARRSLMDKGLVDAPQHGFLEFTAPGFAEFVRRTADL
ncbi:ATP-binding protein [Corynebacterium mastitidis]|uniref:ATP-binding protein n=1 Tax=Corynebacterium mastitidis TaxID=161890 RepID=A0A2N0X809_9CORY|nr:ATP-binding protein [Corynebacterium mastitidis]MCH6196570.1 ATP-binding protein [Corynebacterium mastitidis]PKF68809.1 ATP-binding protein [Corynebacterium mastitidis]